MTRSLRWTAAACAVLTLAAALSACTTGARRGALTAPLTEATLIDSAHPLFQAVVVGAVTGGRTTDLVGASQISSVDFRRALQTSLDVRAMFADEDPVAPQDARFLLEATIEQVEREILDINVDVTTVILYELTDIDTGAVLFVRRVRATYEAPFTDSFIRSERFRLANEGSGQANISAFLDALAADVAQRPEAYAPPPEPEPEPQIDPDAPPVDGEAGAPAAAEDELAEDEMIEDEMIEDEMVEGLMIGGGRVEDPADDAVVEPSTP